MNQAIDVLRSEHQAIACILKILQRMANRARLGTASGTEVGTLLDFLWDFVEQCHHGKEEGLLFPALRRTCLEQGCELIDELSAEHRQGGLLMRALRKAVEPVFDAETFAATARQYVEFVERHIAKENAELFPLAQQILRPDQLDAMQRDFAAFELKTVGRERSRQLHEQMRRWQGE